MTTGMADIGNFGRKWELCQLRHGQGVDILPDGHGLSGLFAAEDAEHSGL